MRRRRRVVAVVCLVVTVAVVWHLVTRGGPSGRVVEGAGPDGWMTVEHEDVRVEIPSSWLPAEERGCTSGASLWAPPEASCEGDRGLAFFPSATFDAAVGPGPRGAGREDSDEDGDPRWWGYAYAREYAVHAGDDDRAVVERVLASVERLN